MTRVRKARRATRARERKLISAIPQQGPGPLDPAGPIRQGDDSVEDPLQDWPEVEDERDQWLLERNGERDEAPDW